MWTDRNNTEIPESQNQGFLATAWSSRKRSIYLNEVLLSMDFPECVDLRAKVLCLLHIVLIAF